MMNNDSNPFAVYEPNAAASREDPGGDFNLAGAARRAARTGSVFVESEIKAQRHFHRHGQVWD